MHARGPHGSRRSTAPRRAALLWAAAAVTAPSSGAVAADATMQAMGEFAIDRTEVTVGQFRRFVEATGTVTEAERRGGGQVYASGWEQRPGWTWHSPFGAPADDDEPAVHVTFDEAAAFCRWAGKRLPRDAEWVEAAYTEHRPSPREPFVSGQTYPYPTGDSPRGANCLGECGSTAALDHSAVLERGPGHARAGTTKAGVNGLFDMGANVWEWVDTGDDAYKRTRGGSWWYGAAQMRRSHLASKPRGVAVVYIGFRCVEDR